MRNFGSVIPVIVLFFHLVTNANASFYFEGNQAYTFLDSPDEKENFSSIASRITSSSIALPHLMRLAISGHEKNHAKAALIHGADSVSIKWDANDIMGTKVKWTGNFTREQHIKMVTAGLAWNNHVAEDVLQDNLGSSLTAEDILWYGMNQLNMSRYIMTKDASDPYDDIHNWLTLVANDEPLIMVQLEKDLQFGAAWQAAGSIVPAFSGVQWILGGRMKMPSFWLNTQTELTDAGVLYSLSLWQKMKNGMTIKVRPGYGWDRTKNKPIYSVEGELNTIHESGVVSSFACGYSKTKGSSYSLGYSMKKRISKKASIEIGSNWYSGYHRLDITSEEGDVELITKLNFSF